MPKPRNFNRLHLYALLSARGRYAGLPRGESLWRDILDVTGGRGIRPFRNPCGSGWVQLEEFQRSVPKLLRNYTDGVAPDCVAASLGMADDRDLYRALEGESVDTCGNECLNRFPLDLAASNRRFA